jgi:GGDEF domain-containing protein
MFPDDGDSSEELMKKADSAMYEAKGAVTPYHFCNTEISERTRDKNNRI